jgi:microcystin-dependent protein
MSPSAVNDSARAMMARLAEQAADTSGSLTTAGGPVAYTVTTNQGYPTPTPNDGQLISVTMNVTNGVNPTLSTDAGTAYAIQGSAGAIPSGTLVAGVPYSMKFSVANSAWMLRNFYNYTSLVPLGGLIPYTGATSPSPSYILPAGQCISTTTYAAYWAVLGSPAPGGCSAGNFAVLDLRGRTLVALDNLGGTPINRLTSAATGCGTVMTVVGNSCANGLESVTLGSTNLPTHTSTNAAQSISVASTSNFATGTVGTDFIGTGASYNTLTSPSVGGVSSTGSNSLSTTFTNASPAAVPKVPPNIAVTYLLRVL